MPFAEQECRLWPVDVASTGVRFRQAFEAMTRTALNGKPALLPEQSADQYLTSAVPGVSELARALFEALERRGERQPQLLLASFSLHYLEREERETFFAQLGARLRSPLALLIIKGVGGTQRPAAPHVRSVHFGVHFVTGEDRSPRVVEAHLALLLPRDWAHADAAQAWLARGRAAGAGARAGGADDEPSSASTASVASTADGEEPFLACLTPSERWVLQMYATLERRCQRQGLRTGVTIASNSWCA